MKNDPAAFLGGKAEVFVQVPSDGFSLAVFIGSQPNHFGLLGQGLEFFYQFFFRGVDLVLRSETVFGIDSEFFARQIGYVSERGFDFVILSQKLFDRLGLGRRLDYHQIFYHSVYVQCFNGHKSSAFARKPGNIFNTKKTPKSAPAFLSHCFPNHCTSFIVVMRIVFTCPLLFIGVVIRLTTRSPSQTKPCSSPISLMSSTAWSVLSMLR